MNSDFVPSKDTELPKEMIKVMESLGKESVMGIAHREGGLVPPIVGALPHEDE